MSLRSRSFRFLGASMLLGLLAACAGKESAPAGAMASASVPDTVAAPSALQGHRQVAFAGLPDRGELLAYADRSEVLHRGAYTWYPVNLSEDHALRAIATGEMRIATPDGRIVALKYERHVEHPDGNWTWVGRSVDGQDAVITFGEEAVFGSIPNGLERPLRLTVQGGRSWLVESDRRAISLLGIAAVRPERPDFLTPPLAPRLKAATRYRTGAAQAYAAASATAIPVVDVVIGYTPGFVNAPGRGTQSKALTRLNNLIEITNQAYANSQMAVQVRLVHAIQVNYPDATDNNVALEELTGYRDGNSIPVPAALQPLVNARETYGADLVTLVRDFRTPENQGCGVAWLLGFAQQPIDSSWSEFGYSVVSDGGDHDEVDDADYFCRDESLAHELGHNMGSAHDRETSMGDDGVLDDDEYGRYPYSFGYKTGTGNFYTVMAYGDSGQTAYRVFSNPNITFCGGFFCGIANQADNARSIAQTAPIIATFRATVVPLPNLRVPNDVNGDGKSDFLLRTTQASSGNFSVWLMNGTQRTASWATTMAVSYRVAATGDFNGDKKLDVVWTSNTADVRVWLGTGTSFTPAFPAIVGSAVGLGVFAGAGDVNGDGKSDLVFRNDQTGSANFTVWLMNGTQKTGSWTATMAASYRVATTGDFNGDGKLDIVWTSANADVRIWLGTGTGFTPAFPAIVGTATGLGAFVGAGDVNGDGKSDLLFRNDQIGTGNFTVWLMNGTQKAGSWSATMAASYRVASTGDFNGDGKLDIAWTSQNRDLRVWTGTGTGFTPSFPTLTGTYASGWTVIKAN